MPPELPTRFTPFYRLEASRNRDTCGTSLGLAIARQLTSAMGGGLKATSGWPSRLRLTDS
ncbi:hypothetical protein HHL21_20695 [Massilia sp. RP-1-19]|uniref:Histidine kinase/HSP90-like ATPase domain-containing protein n=1 Tax=Massilia polaris TaxID=2728846 RepID=A0A848HTP9_9BURK|nr:hypothetical protein [Massilia polaris]